MKKASLILMAAVLIGLPHNAQANDAWSMAKSEDYGTKAGGMFGRGLVNVGTCFVDLLVHTVEGTQNGPAFIGTMSGLGSGLGCSALRVTSGALDVLTFWVPNYNGFPLSTSYSNCLEGTSLAPQPVVQPAQSEQPSVDWKQQQDSLNAEREAFEKSRQKALDDLEKEKAKLAAEQKKTAQNKLKYIK